MRHAHDLNLRIKIRHLLAMTAEMVKFCDSNSKLFLKLPRS
jgi:hypothetical protein